MIEKTIDEMLATFKERNAKYSDNWRAMGPVMTAIFPDGVTLKTEEDFIKFALFEWAIGKLVRYGRTGFAQGDGVLDAAVYCAILKSFMDEENPVTNNYEPEDGPARFFRDARK